MMILFCGHNRLFVNFNSAIDSFSLPDLRGEISKDSQLNYILRVFANFTNCGLQKYRLWADQNNNIYLFYINLRF